MISVPPPVLPGSVVRHVLELSKDPLRTQQQWHREHGDIVLLPVPGFRVWFVQHPDLVHQVMVRDHTSFRKDWYTRTLSELLGNGLLTNEGASWRTQRRLVQPSFHHTALQGYARAMVAVTDRHLQGWSDDSELDAHGEMMHLTLQVVAATLFGADVADDAQRISDALDVWMHGVRGFLGTGYRIPLAVPTPHNRRMQRALVELDDVVQGLVDHHRAEPRDDTLLGMLIAATDEDGGGMSDRQLRDEALTLLMAGHETTAAWLTMALYLISQHPRVEERLHAEVDTVLQGRSPELSDVKDLPYTRALLDEVLRLYPPAYTMGREATVPVDLGGHRIRPGDQVWASQWAIQRDPRFYDNPDRFEPQRWLDGLSKTLPKGAYFPFGLGPRLCIGRRFAELEATLVLATIAQAWSLRLAPGETLKLMPTVTLRPESGLRMRAALRRARRSEAA
jgi:cytochrome P450